MVDGRELFSLGFWTWVRKTYLARTVSDQDAAEFHAYHL